MIRIDESLEEKLLRLRVETEPVAPRNDFALRVMAKLDSSVQTGKRDDWSLQVLRWARVGMTVATLAAAAGLVMAWNSTTSADQEEALAYGVVEIFE